jgi:type IV pilus assembly protein PilE
MTRTRTRGFTMIEVMIVVVIVGILAAIAYPNYQNYIKRSNRSAAETLMMDLANREQQYLLDNRAYLGGGASAVTTLLSPNPVPVEVSKNYDVTIASTAGPPPTFTITATPKAGTTMAGDGVLTLDQDGTKLVDGAVSDKWQGR